jgi:hypothetical protein
MEYNYIFGGFRRIFLPVLFQPSHYNYRPLKSLYKENIEIILQIPSENVKSLLVDTVHSGIVGEAVGPLNVRPPVGPNFGPTLELGNEVIELNDDLYVLHSELETFIIGGVIKDPNGVPFRGGPIPGKNFQAVVLLENVPDNYIIDLTCIFMSNSNYKSTFNGEAAKFSEMDTGDKIGHVIGVRKGSISFLTGFLLIRSN